MESVKTRFMKTKEHVHHNNATSVEHGKKPKSLKAEAKVIRSDYTLLSDHSSKWMDAVQEMQTKWEVLANTIANFGTAQYVDKNTTCHIAEGFHGLQNLMFPIIKTTKIGIHDNASNISHCSVDKLKKQNHRMEDNRVRADHANHKLDKYRQKSKTNPTRLKRKEASAEKANIVYDESYRKYQHDVRDLEYKSEDNLHNSRQLLFDLQDFFNEGYSDIHSLKQEIDLIPVQEKLYSRYGILDVNLPKTYTKYHSEYIPKDHLIPLPHGEIIYDDEDLNNNNNNDNLNNLNLNDKDSEAIVEEKTTTTTTTYQVPANMVSPKFNEGSSSTINETIIPTQQTYISSTTDNAPTTSLDKDVIVPTVVEQVEYKQPVTNVVSPQIVHEYVYESGSNSAPIQNNVTKVTKETKTVVEEKLN